MLLCVQFVPRQLLINIDVFHIRIEVVSLHAVLYIVYICPNACHIQVR